MGWTAPRTWADDEIVTTAYMNAQIRDNLLTLSTHAHGGSAGDGSSTLASGISFSGLATSTFADQSGNPAVTGRLQRNGNDLVYYNGSAVITLSSDASAGTGSLRTIGTGATNAAAGNHTHTPTTASDSAVTGSDITDTNVAVTRRKKSYTSGQTLDGTSKTVTPTKATNLVMVYAFVATISDADNQKVSVKETVSASETNVQTGITTRFYERIAGSTIYQAYGFNLFERADRTAATYTYHIEANDSVDVWGAYLIASSVEV